MDLFLSTVDTKKFDFLFLCETWLVEYENPYLNKTFNCIVVPATREAKLGRFKGGIVCLYRKSYQIEIIFSETYGLFILAHSLDIILGCMYLPPESPESSFLQLHDVYTSITTEYHFPLFIGGDLNTRVGLGNQSSEECFEGTQLTNERRSVD